MLDKISLAYFVSTLLKHSITLNKITIMKYFVSIRLDHSGWRDIHTDSSFIFFTVLFILYKSRVPLEVEEYRDIGIDYADMFGR